MVWAAHADINGTVEMTQEQFDTIYSSEGWFTTTPPPEETPVAPSSLLHYAGPWAPSTQYSKGDLITSPDWGLLVFTIDTVTDVDFNETGMLRITPDPVGGGSGALSLSQLTLTASTGFSGQIFEVFDEFGNPIGSIGPTGGFNVFGDDNRVFPGGDVFDPINRLRSNGTVQQNGGDPSGSVGAIARGNIVTQPSGVPDGSHLEGGSTTRPGILPYALNGRSFRMALAGTVQEDNVPTFRRVMAVYKDGGAATISSVGAPAAALDLTSGSQVSNDQALIAGLVTLTTGTASGNTAGVLPPSYAQLKPAWQPMMWTRILTDPTAVSTVRYWVGLFSADPAAIASPTGIHVMGFRYDTSVDGTAFWRCVTSAASGSPTVTTTTIAVAAATKYELRIEANAVNNAVRFFINEFLVATHTTTLPTFSQTMGPAVRCTALAGSAARAVQFSRWVLEHVG